MLFHWLLDTNKRPHKTKQGKVYIYGGHTVQIRGILNCKKKNYKRKMEKVARGCRPHAAVAFWKFHVPLLQRRERNFSPPSSTLERRLSFSPSGKTSQKRTWKFLPTSKKSREQNLEGSETATPPPNFTLPGNLATLFPLFRNRRKSKKKKNPHSRRCTTVYEEKSCLR